MKSTSTIKKIAKSSVMSSLIALSISTASNVQANEHNQKTKGKILMIAANPSVSKITGWPIGLWAAELTHPYWEFANSGYDIEIASPNGGKLEFDGYSDPEHESGYSAKDLISLGWKHSKNHMALIQNSKKMVDIDIKNYNAIFFVGGQSPMYTFRGNKEVTDFAVEFFQTGKPTALVCHSTSILLDAKLPNGKYLVDGKKWTGFANSEEKFADNFVGKKIQPFWIEDEARKISNTKFIVKPAFTPFAIADGNLITGQQQNSGAEAARLVIKALEKKGN